MKLGDIASMLTKSYLFTHVAKDVAKFVERNMSDIELDRDYWLHKAGLSTYSPVKSSLGGFSVFLFGLLAGGIAGLALAPKSGFELRNDVKDRAMNLLNRPEIKGQASATA